MSEEKGMVSQEAVTATSADAGSIMPLAADLSRTQDVTTVSEVSTINSTDQFYMNQSGKFVQVDYSKLADAILGKISSKTYSLDQGTKTLIAAINELNSKSLFPIKYYNADSVTHGSTSNRATIIKRMYETYFTNKQNSVLFFGIRYSQGYYYFYIMYSVTTRVYVLEVSYYLDVGTMIWQRNTDSGDFEAKS